MKVFPSRTRRNCSIAKAVESFEQEVGVAEQDSGAGGVIILAGRIIGILDDGFVLLDESGRLDIESREKVNVGDIIEVKVQLEIRNYELQIGIY